MKSTAIPEEIREQVRDIVINFNRTTFPSGDCYFEVRFHGKFLYLDRCDYGTVGPMCRLTYNGKVDDWSFAIFRWSNERYDSDEWMISTQGSLKSIVEDAMDTGLDIYPT
jgi:hypothetical protein